MVVGHNRRCLFGDAYHSNVVFLEDFLGVHRGTGVLTHSQVQCHGRGRRPVQRPPCSQPPAPECGKNGAHLFQGPAVTSISPRDVLGVKEKD